jgi:hypothetical protein
MILRLAAATIGEYAEWLTHTKLPKILLYANPGVAITETEVEWCRENMVNLKTVDIGDGSISSRRTIPIRSVWSCPTGTHRSEIGSDD